MFVSALVVVLIMLLMCAKDSYKLYHLDRLLRVQSARVLVVLVLTMEAKVVLAPNLVMALLWLHWLLPTRFSFASGRQARSLEKIQMKN